MPTVIHWFRRDLRLADNPALSAALAMRLAVVPLYILDDDPQIRPLGSASRWWLHHSLKSLDASLRARGSQLVLRRSSNLTHALLTFARQVRAHHITFMHITADDKREQMVIAALKKAGVTAQPFSGMTLFDPATLRTQQGDFFRVFTPFQRACIARYQPSQPLAAPARLPPLAPMPAAERLEDWQLLRPEQDGANSLAPYWQPPYWEPGEAGAAARLDAFLKPITDYAHQRNRMDKPGTSRLSPHLSFGEISPQQCAAQLAQSLEAHPAGAHPPGVHPLGARPVGVHPSGAHPSGAQAFLRQIIWREFCHHLLHHHPTITHQPLRAEWQHFPWREEQELICLWQAGRTGFPAVDAGMRELQHSGWMHNRARLITASFLVKHLLQPWQSGEAWFWDKLIDADPANNAANWQWVAGCGADAAPYFRIFNPMLQGAKCDPQAAYIKQWLPELAHLEIPHIYAPWQAPLPLLASHYPPPIIDHSQARKRALALHRSFRESIQAGTAPRKEHPQQGTPS